VHVLTKIFIVLVALLSVMLVPLVVVYAKNEDNFKSQFQRADNLRASADSALRRAESAHGVEIANLQGEIARLNEMIGTLKSQGASKDGEIAGLKSDLAIAQTQMAQISSQINSIGGTLEAGQTLIASLVQEANDLRTAMLTTERQYAELEASSREQGRQLEVANSAVRALQEEVQRLSEAEATAVRTIAMYQERHGALDVNVGSLFGQQVPIDVKVLTSIIDVRNANGITLCEIDAGQRDGVKVGWVMTLSDGQGNYLGRLRIINVDVDRATGVAESAGGQPVTPSIGARASAFPAE